jgi:hypothetical protein
MVQTFRSAMDCCNGLASTGANENELFRDANQPGSLARCLLPYGTDPPGSTE